MHCNNLAMGVEEWNNQKARQRWFSLSGDFLCFLWTNKYKHYGAEINCIFIQHRYSSTLNQTTVLSKHRVFWVTLVFPLETIIKYNCSIGWHSTCLDGSWNKIPSPLCLRPRQDQEQMWSIPRRARDLRDQNQSRVRHNSYPWQYFRWFEVRGDVRWSFLCLNIWPGVPVDSLQMAALLWTVLARIALVTFPTHPHFCHSYVCPVLTFYRAHVCIRTRYIKEPRFSGENIAIRLFLIQD